MKTIFIGIDISKATLDVAICNSRKSIIEQFQVSNDEAGMNELLPKIPADAWVCFEHTGPYGALLTMTLSEHNFPFSVVPALEIKNSSGMTRGKDDKVDAARIALYAAKNEEKLKPSQLPAALIKEVKDLLSYRGQLVKTQVQFTNSLKARLSEPEKMRSGFVIEDLTAKIGSLQNDVKAIEKKIEQIITSDHELKKNYNQIKSVKGIGLIIAASMLVYTNNFTSFDSPRKFNCYAGIAPFNDKSGTIQKPSKVSHLRNKTMKTLLYNGANTAVNFDPQLKAYYKRKKGQGKHHQSIMNAVACKLVYRVFAVVKREEPYVQFSF
jgi:transposase